MITTLRRPKNAAAGWEAATGNTVTVEAVDWGTAHAKILTAATSGEGPDIMTGGLSWGIEFGELGGMIDLNAQYPDDVAVIQAADNPGNLVLYREHRWCCLRRAV